MKRLVWYNNQLVEVTDSAARDKLTYVCLPHVVTEMKHQHFNFSVNSLTDWCNEIPCCQLQFTGYPVS